MTRDEKREILAALEDCQRAIMTLAKPVIVYRLMLVEGMSGEEAGMMQAMIADGLDQARVCVGERIDELDAEARATMAAVLAAPAPVFRQVRAA